MAQDSVKEIVVKRLLEAMEKGVCPWRKPWKDSGLKPCNIAGRKYSGLNWFILSLMPYAKPIYLTFNQAKKMGGSVKKGEKGVPVIFWKMLVKENAQGVRETIPMLRYYTVFNISQVENITLPKRFSAPVPEREFTPIESAEKIYEGMQNRPALAFGGDRACYIPAMDECHMPEKTQFESEEHFYATLFHELSHSTGHTSRLNRKEVMGGTFFGSHDYSLEELVAEMSSAMICAETGIEQPILENSAAYLNSWYSQLSKDPGMLITAASKAQKAADYIIGKVEEEEVPADEVA